MFLAIDVGNTNVVFALLSNEGELQTSWRLSTDTMRTADEYSVLFDKLLEPKSLNKNDVTAGAIACVVPQHLYELKQFCRDYLGFDPLIVSGEAPSVLTIDLKNPEEVGADRIVNTLAAINRYEGAAIIIDFGTATTFDVVTEDRRYIGGAIAPGIGLSIDALHKAAAKLPEIAITKPESAIGKNTVEAMQSGVYYGYKGVIEQIIASIKAENEASYSVIATGGLASLFAEATDVIDAVEPDLTIYGIFDYYQAMKA